MSSNEQDIFRRGARLRRKIVVPLVVPAAAEPAAESQTRMRCWELARANKHKPWARRWLKSQGCWL